MQHLRHTIDCEPSQPGYVAAYLREAGESCMFVEAYTSRARPLLLGALAERGRRPEDVRWVLVTHAHLDHAGGAGALLAACPNATLLAHPRAARNLIDPTKLVASATAVYGEARFREIYGTIEPIAAERVQALEDGATFELGDATLRVHHTAGHAKHHFVVDDPATATVFTGDTFGLVYPALQGRGRLAFPSTSPTDFDPAEARKSVAKVLSLAEPTACPTHFGEVDGLEAIAEQMRSWIDRAEAWLEEATASDRPVAELEETLTARWRAALEDEARSRGLVLGVAEWRGLGLGAELKAQGIALLAAKRRKEGGAG